MFRDPGFWVVVFFVACLVTVMARASRFASVSTVSEPIALWDDAAIDAIVLSTAYRQKIKRRQLQGVRTVSARKTKELENLKLENQRLQTQLRDITVGQLKGIDLFLEAERNKKLLTRTAATLLLGKDKSTGLEMIRQREPVPPEIAQPEPLPT